MTGLFRYLGTGLTVLFWALVAGCQSGPAPRETFYRLAPDFEQLVHNEQACGTLLVGRLGTRGFAGGRAIVFRDEAEPLQVQRYNYHLWSESPALMIQDALARSLRATASARYVITPAERANADWIVSGILLRMEHFPDALPAKVVIEAELGIVGTETRQALFLQRYIETESATSNRIDDAVHSFNQALQRMLLRFQADAAKVLIQHRVACE